MVLAVIDTIVEFLRNEESYIPFRATAVGCGGTGKSYTINAILTIVQKMTKSVGQNKIRHNKPAMDKCVGRSKYPRGGRVSTLGTLADVTQGDTQL